MNPTYGFEGQVAVVTGASSGMGLATAQAFADAGAAVVLADIDGERLRDATERLTAAGQQALGVTCDVADENQVVAMVERTIATYGRLDMEFNNAGIMAPPTDAADEPAEQFDRVNDINLGGVFLCMKYRIPLLRQQGGGAIVNTSSGAGVKGFKGQAAYAATKWGVIGLSKSVALDYAAEGIRINVVAPGIIDTEMMDRFSGGTEKGRQSVIAQEPVGRMGRPEEIAAAVLYLCSDEAAFTTGAVLVVDGGQTV